MSPIYASFSFPDFKRPHCVENTKEAFFGNGTQGPEPVPLQVEILVEKCWYLYISSVFKVYH